jgi:hypothetical protein
LQGKAADRTGALAAAIYTRYLKLFQAVLTALETLVELHPNQPAGSG